MWARDSSGEIRLAVVDAQRKGEIYEIDLKEPEKRGVATSLPSEVAWESTEERRRRIDFYWLERSESEEPELTYAIFEEEEGKEKRVIGWYDPLAGEGGLAPRVNGLKWIPKELWDLLVWAEELVWKEEKLDLKSLGLPRGILWGWMPADRTMEFNPGYSDSQIGQFIKRVKDLVDKHPEVFDEYSRYCLSLIKKLLLLQQKDLRRFWLILEEKECLLIVKKHGLCL